MKRKSLKATIALLLTFILMNLLVINIFAVSYTIDNDDAQGFSNYGSANFTLYYGSNLWYGDGRLAASGSMDTYYDYYYPSYRATSSSQKIYGEIKAWLYDINFTDNSTSYCLRDAVNDGFYSAGIINQDLAAPGWNNIGVAVLNGKSSGKIQCADRVRIYSNWWGVGTNCGADAIEVILTLH